MNKTNRIVFGILLTLSFAVTFFMLGAFLAGQTGAAEGQGLAGGAIVLGYGLMGAAIGVVLAIVLSIYLPAKWLIGVCVVFVIGGSVGFWVILSAVQQSRDRTAQHLQQTYQNLPHFQVTLINTGAGKTLPFERMEMDWSQRSYQVTNQGSVCTITLTGEQAVQILTALREVESVTFSDSNPCADSNGPTEVEFEMGITEAKPPHTRAHINLDEACLNRYPQLQAPLTVAREINRDNGLPDDCG